MKVIVYIRREFRCANGKYALCGALGCLFAGMLSLILGGRAKLYSVLLLPRFAPPPIVFIIGWILCLFLMGAAFGIAVSPCQCGGKHTRIRAIVCFSLLMIAVVCWYPIFFAARLFLVSILLSGAVLLAAFLTLRAYALKNILSVALMILPFLWIAFLFLLNFCIVLLN